MDINILANIFSLIGATLLCISTFSKKKENMLLIQAGDCCFNSIACFLAESYSSMTTNLICLIRNIFNVKGWLNKYLLILFSIVLLAIGFIVNTKGIIGLLPPIASVEYTIWSTVTKNTKSIKLGLLINLICWAIHDIIVGLYPSFITDIIIIIVTSINLIRDLKRKETINE